MGNRRLPDQMIEREMLVILHSLPWQTRGRANFAVSLRIQTQPEDLVGSLDWFSRHRLEPALLYAIHSNKCGHEQSLGNVAGESFNGSRAQAMFDPERQELLIAIVYHAPDFEYDVPAFFWLGESAEAYAR